MSHFSMSMCVQSHVKKVVLTLFLHLCFLPLVYIIQHSALDILNMCMHNYLPLLSSIVTVALGGFNMAAGSTDVRVTIIVSELSTMVSSRMGIVTV